MKVFPHILCRIGGETFDVWNQVDLTELNHNAGTLRDSQKDRKSGKESLTADLLEHIRTLDDARQQNILQNFRRDLFNERPVKRAVLESVRPLMTNDLNIKVDGYLKLCERQAQLYSHYTDTYNKVLTESRKHLQFLANNENLRKGLLLSSRSLFEALNSFRQADPSRFRNKEARIEESILKYLTRITTKTSPFSTFNNLAYGRLVENGTAPLRMKSEREAGVDSRIMLNNNIYEYFRDLFIAWRPVYLQLFLRANPSIVYNPDHYHFLTNNRNTEAFQRIPLSPVISYILEAINEHAEGIRFRDLIAKMMEDIDASSEDLETHIKRLIDLGLIEYDFGVSGIDPQWDIELIKKLKILDTTDAPLANDLIGFLQELRTLAQAIAQSDSSQRDRFLQEAYQKFRDISMKIHEAAGLPESERQETDQPTKEKPTKALSGDNGHNPEFLHTSHTSFYFKAEQIFYEDTLRKVNPEIDHSMLYDIVEAYDQLIHELGLSNGMLDQRERIAEFLKENNANNIPIGLLTFYELHSRETKKREEERRRKEEERKKQGNHEIAIDDYKAAPAASQKRWALIRAWNEELAKSIAPLIADNPDELALTYQLIKQLNDRTGVESYQTSDLNSFSMFVQFFVETDGNGKRKLKAVLNSSLPGYGKMLSRFLHLLPENVVEDLRTWNNTLNESGDLFMEDTDASFFNANLHPPLLPYEIRIPGGHNTLPPQRQLPGSDFVVTLEENTERPLLIHKPTGKRAMVFDLGFQGPVGRSALFKLLSKFSIVDYVGPGGPVSIINNCFEEKQKEQKPQGKKILKRPRVVYEDKIVLQRKGWLIDKELLPVRKVNEDDASYYLRIQEWREINGIDAHVFVFANPIVPNQADGDTWKKLGKDDYKPQYIDLANPVFIGLFEKLMEKVPTTMKIEEMLPSPNHLCKISDERFVTEFIVHWYNFKNDAKSKQPVASNVSVDAS